MLLSEKEEKAVWEQVYQRFCFTPSTDRNMIPFCLPEPWMVYDISAVLSDPALYEKTENRWPTNEDGILKQLTQAVDKVLLSCMTPEELLYALDWQHACYRFVPGNLEERKTFYKKELFGCRGEVDTPYYFPLYVPDGDYFFFFPEDFRFGYLGHPWRQEVWIFGEKLVAAFEAAVQKIPVLSGFCRKKTP